jgi:deoxyhypusine synthase
VIFGPAADDGEFGQRLLRAAQTELHLKVVSDIYAAKKRRGRKDFGSH